MNNDLDELGREIIEEISGAINKKSYINLNRKVSKITSNAVKSAGEGIKSAFASFDDDNSGKDDYSYDSPAGTMRDIKGRNYRRSDIEEDEGWKNTKTAQYINRINKEHRRSGSKTGKRNHSEDMVLYDKATAKKITSIISMIVGFPVGLVLLLTVLITAAVKSPWLLLLLLIPGAFLGLGFNGLIDLNFFSRFDKYVSALSGKTYGDIKLLAQSVGRSEKSTLKDLKKMISKGLFRQGHLDNDEKTLITSDASYDQYLIAEKDHQERLMEEQRKKERISKEQAGWTEEQKEIFKTCEEYISEIRHCNDEIPGEVMSSKIDRMEHSVSQILDRAKKQPKLINDLRRLMNYYLPTTVKLLNAYAELDSQEKTSENIEKSKKEIEDTIDTLNDAFDKLFDELFEDTNLDISTDAQVMKTLLEQEGLTGHRFTSDNKL